MKGLYTSNFVYGSALSRHVGTGTLFSNLISLTRDAMSISLVNRVPGPLDDPSIIWNCGLYVFCRFRERFFVESTPEPLSWPKLVQYFFSVDCLKLKMYICNICLFNNCAISKKCSNRNRK